MFCEFCGTGPDCAVCGRADPMAELVNELADALRYAAELIPTARRYFPKSVQNRDKFDLENTCATIGRALNKVTPEPVEAA